MINVLTIYLATCIFPRLNEFKHWNKVKQKLSATNKQFIIMVTVQSIYIHMHVYVWFMLFILLVIKLCRRSVSIDKSPKHSLTVLLYVRVQQFQVFKHVNFSSLFHFRWNYLTTYTNGVMFCVEILNTHSSSA